MGKKTLGPFLKSLNRFFEIFSISRRYLDTEGNFWLPCIGLKKWTYICCNELYLCSFKSFFYSRKRKKFTPEFENALSTLSNLFYTYAKNQVIRRNCLIGLNSASTISVQYIVAFYVSVRYKHFYAVLFSSDVRSKSYLLYKLTFQEYKA